jgi:hypothetical protein
MSMGQRVVFDAIRELYTAKKYKKPKTEALYHYHPFFEFNYPREDFLYLLSTWS